jgi:hypothetical protein
MNGQVLDFGSRSGTWVALALFTVVFGALGWAVAKQIKSQFDGSSAVARAVGLAVSAGLLSVTYSSSFGGFYEAEIANQDLQLRYLVTESRIPLAEIVSVSATPWYKGRWRLEIATRTSSRYKSATWHREPIEESATRLNAVLKRP